MEKFIKPNFRRGFSVFLCKCNAGDALPRAVGCTIILGVTLLRRFVMSVIDTLRIVFDALDDSVKAGEVSVETLRTLKILIYKNLVEELTRIEKNG